MEKPKERKMGIVGNRADPIRILAESEGVDSLSGNIEIIDFKVNILGQSVCFRIGVENKQAGVADLVPLARTICTKVTDMVVENISNNGGVVPCHKGCSACCKYLVPLSIPEAFRLRDDILAMPKIYRVQMERRYLMTARRVLRNRPPTCFADETTEPSSVNLTKLNTIASWYTNLKLACPFLNKGVCTIYEQRPLACREYFVTSPARECKGGRGTAKKVEMPVRMSEVIGQLVKELESVNIYSMILPLALAHCKKNPKQGERTWPAVKMVQRFVEIIIQMAGK